MIALESQEIIFTEEPRLYWMAGESYKSVTGLLGGAGISPNFNFVPPRLLEHAIARGNAVHLATHLLDEGKLDEDTVDPQIAGYVDAYRLFRRECRIAMIAREQKTVSTLGFGMRPDIVAWICGRRAIVDLKTAQNLGKSTGPQTAGYKIGWNSIHPRERIEDRYGLRLQANGMYKLIPYEKPEDEHCFMDCLALSAKPTPELLERITNWRSKYGN